MKTFFAELVKSTTFTAKVSVVKTTLHEWLRDHVYQDDAFRFKLQEVLYMFITHQISNEQIYMLVEKMDMANKLKPLQVDYLINAFSNSCSARQIVQNFVRGETLADDELGFIASFLVREIDEAYKLPQHY